jgi:hypothetical protein
MSGQRQQRTFPQSQYRQQSVPSYTRPSYGAYVQQQPPYAYQQREHVNHELYRNGQLTRPYVERFGRIRVTNASFNLLENFLNYKLLGYSQQVPDATNNIRTYCASIFQSGDVARNFQSLYSCLQDVYSNQNSQMFSLLRCGSRQHDNSRYSQWYFSPYQTETETENRRTLDRAYVDQILDQICFRLETVINDFNSSNSTPFDDTVIEVFRRAFDFFTQMYQVTHRLGQELVAARRQQQASAPEQQTSVTTRFVPPTTTFASVASRSAPTTTVRTTTVRRVVFEDAELVEDVDEQPFDVQVSYNTSAGSNTVSRTFPPCRCSSWSEVGEVAMTRLNLLRSDELSEATFTMHITRVNTTPSVPSNSPATENTTETA